MRKLLTTKKAVSKVIPLLLIMISVFVAGCIYYNYTAAAFGSMKNSFQTQMALLLLESVKINSTCIKASVRNSGIMEAIITKAYVNGMSNILRQSITIAGGSVGTAILTGTFKKGLTYAVELVSNFGAPLTFSAMYQ